MEENNCAARTILVPIIESLECICELCSVLRFPQATSRKDSTMDLNVIHYLFFFFPLPLPFPAPRSETFRYR